MAEKCSDYCEILTNGIYKCKWRTSDSFEDQTKLLEKCWWWILVLIFMFGVTWLFCWSVFSNDYNGFEWFIYENAGFWFGWGLLILIVLILVVFYISLLLCTGVLLIIKGQSKHLHLCHKVSIILVFVFCVAGYILVDQLWNEQYYSAVIALKMTGPWLHISLLFVVTASSWLMFYEIMGINNRNAWIGANIGVLALFLCVFFIPLFITSPCIGPDLNSIPKPLLIGHRLGNVKNAPENTVLAYEEGNQSCTTFAVETDVSISVDGVAFLMHDTDTIKRTTNVKDVFPDKANQRAEFFTWTELRQLDAGSWYLKEDPFHKVRFLSEEQKNEIRRQKIPSLNQIARIIGQHSIIFDLYQPSPGHPYRHNFTEVALNALLSSDLPQNQVLWLSGFDRKNVGQEAPGFVMVGTASSVEYLHANNISIVNLGYLEHTPEDIARYIDNNISVILYNINAPWLFSYAWCQGTKYVTTDSCVSLSRISNPIWTLSKGGYIAMWVCLDLFALIVLVVIFFVQYHRSNCSFLPCFTNQPIQSPARSGIDNLSFELHE